MSKMGPKKSQKAAQEKKMAQQLAALERKRAGKKKK
jgi:hypothetical protein